MHRNDWQNTQVAEPQCRGISSPAVTCNSLRPTPATDPSTRQPQLQLCTSLRRICSRRKHPAQKSTRPAAAAPPQKAAPDAAPANVHPFPFTLQQLVTFQAVACADCFDAAAEHLGLAKRTVPLQLAKLEETVSISSHALGQNTTCIMGLKSDLGSGADHDVVLCT